MEPIKKYWKTGLFLASWLGLLAFLMRHDQQMPWVILGIGVIFAASIVLAKLPGLTNWAEANAGLVRLLGLVVAVAGPAGIVIVIYLANGAPKSDWITGLAISAIFLGALIFMLPRVNRNKAITKEMVAGAPAPAVTDTKLIDEVKFSFAFVLEHLPAFVRVAALWLLLDILLNLWAMHLLSLPEGSDERSSSAFAFLTGYILVLAFAMPAVAVAWHRYVMRGDLPRWGIVPPNGRFWRYFYRIWIFTIMVGAMDKLVSSNAQDISHLVGPAAGRLIASALEDLIYLLAIWGVGMYALVLPAVAIDDRDVNAAVALRMVWPRRLQFATGFLATILIFYLAITALRFAQDIGKGDSGLPSVVLGMLSFLLILFATATSATYLSRAYLRARAQPLAA